MSGVSQQAKQVLSIVMMIAICVYIGAKFQSKIVINATENPEAAAANTAIWAMLWETFGMFEIVLLLIVVGIIWYLLGGFR